MQVKYLKKEVEKFKKAAMQARDSYVKLRKERDYHRMHHWRVVQEKNRLITDIKRLKVSALKLKLHMKSFFYTKIEQEQLVGV